MEKSYIDIDNFNISNLYFENNNLYYEYGYGKDIFNLLIKDISHYNFLNDNNKTIMYFNVLNDKLQKILRAIEQKYTNKYQMIRINGLDLRKVIDTYEYNYNNVIKSYDKLKIIKSDNINIDLKQDIRQILNELNNNDYVLNIIITFDNIISSGSFNRDDETNNIYVSYCYYINSYISFIKIDKDNIFKDENKKKYKHKRKILFFEDKYNYYMEKGIDKYNIMTNYIL